jgi:hypothetical protein
MCRRTWKHDNTGQDDDKNDYDDNNATSFRNPIQRIEHQLRRSKNYDSSKCYLQMQAKC